jgi:bacillopeptidase F
MYRKAFPIILTLIIIILIMVWLILMARNNPQTNSTSGPTISKAENKAVQNTDQEITSTREIITPTTPPSLQEIPLSITSPTDGITVTNPSLTVKGITLSNAEVFVNDKETAADAKGNFSATLILDDGENIIVVTANDLQGNSAEKELTVIYDSPQGK